MKVEVLQEDIDKGIRRNPWHCPVALAIARKVRARQRKDVRCLVVAVSNSGCTVRDRETGTWNKYNLPEKAKRFILLYDTTDQKLDPIVFEMRRKKK